MSPAAEASANVRDGMSHVASGSLVRRNASARSAEQVLSLARSGNAASRQSQLRSSDLVSCSSSKLRRSPSPSPANAAAMVGENGRAGNNAARGMGVNAVTKVAPRTSASPLPTKSATLNNSLAPTELVSAEPDSSGHSGAQIATYRGLTDRKNFPHSPRVATKLADSPVLKRNSQTSPKSPLETVNVSSKSLPSSNRLPSPAAKERAQKKLVLAGNEKPKSAAAICVSKRDLRSSVEGEFSSGNDALKRHSPLLASSQRIAVTPGRRKSLTSEGREAKPVPPLQVDAKAGEDVRLDLRGQNIRRLDHNHISLTPKLEFVYLRDNKLSSLNGIEVLRRVKVLDLSFNEVKGAGLEVLANCKALQQLYLAGNQINSLSALPQLPNLEFLSVAQNKLKSLSMPSQPRLQVLAASNNKISTFKGFPHLPMLEHLRLEENPILDIHHAEAASILIVGPTLKRFNDRDLLAEEQKLACLYPAHTALCMREGWEFCGFEEAAESTLQFLVGQWSDKLPLGYTVKEALVNSPSEEDCCSCLFILEKVGAIQEEMGLTLKYQWYVGDKTAMNFVPIQGAVNKTYWPKHEDVGCCLKVECSPVIGEREYPSIFAISSPVAPGTGCPKVLSLKVEGKLMEGCSIQAHAEVAWCGDTPGKGIVSWLRRHGNGSPVAIMAAEEHEYHLALDDVGANLLLMYTPVTEDGVKGESHFATTGVVQAALPSVSCVQVLGHLVEGSTIKGIGKYFGGREGLSVYEWLCEDPQSGEFNLVSRGTNEYMISKEDVSLRIMFVYTPVNIEGHRGDPVSAITERVLIAPPRATDLKIVGDIREANVVSVSVNVIGGLEEASRVQWFKTDFPDASAREDNLEAVSSCKTLKDFRIPLGAVGYYLAARYIPVRADGECGEPVLVFSDQTVEMLPPSVTFLSVNGEATEGEILSASYGYIGGHEGTSEYSWHLHKDESDIGAPIPTAAGMLQYEITKAAINKLVSFKCTPARYDGIVGEPRIAMVQNFVQPGVPKILSLEIAGDPVEGADLHVEKKYWGGEEGLSKLQWFLVKPDGVRHEIKGAVHSNYRVCSDDIGCLLSVFCEPYRTDGVKGSVTISQLVGPVSPGSPSCESLEFCGEAIEGGSLSFQATYRGGGKGACTSKWFRRNTDRKEDWLSNSERLYLTSKDIGCQILLVFTPVRKDGLSGAPCQIISDTVKEAEPVGTSLSIPHCCEGTKVLPQKSYYGGKEGCSEYRWFRSVSSVMETVLPEEAVILANTMTYTPTLEDVGMLLSLCWTPIRSDGKKGMPLTACCKYPVASASPTVKNVTIREISPGTLLGDGEYFGGFEGNSIMSWYRQSADEKVALIEGASSKTYVIVEDDYTCSLIFGYTPVREDGAIGKTIFSEKSSTILPDLPRARSLSVNGKPAEGEVLTAFGVTFENEAEQHIWETYKKDVKYQWSRSSAPSMTESFEVLPLQRANLYKIRSEDVGFSLRCECAMTDIFGRTMRPISVITPPVAPGVPKVDKLEIEGRGYHTNLYAVRGIYSGGREGKSMIQWFRAMSGRPDLIPITGEVGRMYEANVDDVGCRLVAVYTPVREDGVGGAPVSASTEPIAVEPEVAKEVKQKLDLGAVKFEALRDRDQSSAKAQTQHGLGSLERRVLDVNKKRFKVVKPGSKTSFPNTEIRGAYGHPFRVEIFHNDQHRLKIVVDHETEVDLMVQTRNLRDVIVLVLRELAQRFL